MSNAPDAPTMTLAELAQALGPPDPALVASLTTPAAIAAYQEQGRLIASSRVLVDAERLLGLAHATWVSASDDRKALLVGFSPELLTVGVHKALALRAATTVAGDAAHADKSARSSSTQSVLEVVGRALPLRDQAVTALKTITTNNEPLTERVASATGDAATPENLASGLERLAKLGHELIASDDPHVAALVKATRVSAAYFDRLVAIAKELRAAVEVARPRLTASTLAQGDIDVLDGLVLRVLSDIIHAFAAAKDIDGTLPTLAPNATRRILGTRSGRKPKPPRPSVP